MASNLTFTARVAGNKSQNLLLIQFNSANSYCTNSQQRWSFGLNRTSTTEEQKLTLIETYSLISKRKRGIVSVLWSSKNKWRKIKIQMSRQARTEAFRLWHTLFALCQQQSIWKGFETEIRIIKKSVEHIYLLYFHWTVLLKVLESIMLNKLILIHIAVLYSKLMWN